NKDQSQSHALPDKGPEKIPITDIEVELRQSPHGEGAQEDSGDEQIARADFGHQGAHHRHGNERAESARQHNNSSLQRRISQNGLQQQRNQHRAAVQHKSQNGHQKDAGSVGPHLENRQVHDGVIGREFANYERGETHNSYDAECQDEMRSEPVLFLAFVEHYLKAGNSNSEISHAQEIDFGHLPLDVRRIENENSREKNRKNPDRNIDVKDPAPAVGVSQPSAKYGSQHGSHDNAQPPEAHCFAAVLRGENFHQNCLR